MRWSRVFPVLAVAVVVVLGVGSAWSQETPADLRVDESKHQRPVLPSLRDFGSFGPALGYMKVFGGDLGKSTQPRPIMQAVFRYRFSEDWIGIGEFGFGWNAFKDHGDTVLTFTFGTLGLARRFGHGLGFDFRGTAGAGFYRWDYKNNGFALRDRYRVPLTDSTSTWAGTQHFYKGIAPGGYVGLEAERRVARHVTLTTAVQLHYVLTTDHQFDRVFNRNYGFTSLRLGANYHFSPTEGILWERKQNRVIRLESGKSGS